MVKQDKVTSKKEKSVAKKNPVESLENDQLFTLTSETTKDADLLKSKRQHPDAKKSGKIIKNTEERKIKRIQKGIQTGKKQPVQEKKEEVLYDLWATNSKATGAIKLEPLTYPKVVLPHPGQSYNPNREDLKNLLQTIVENERPKNDPTEEIQPVIELTEGRFGNSDEDVTEEENEEEIKVSNNPPVNDEDRLTRTKKNKLVNKVIKKHQRKMNRLKNKEQEMKKKQKVEVDSMKLIKRFNKETLHKQKLDQEKETKEKEIKQKKKEFVVKGVAFDDTDALDYKINKQSTSLKNMTVAKNLISDRYENILKRNVVGESTVLNRRKKNSKENQDYMFDEGDDQLKIIN